jgi:hypothetical protein
MKLDLKLQRENFVKMSFAEKQNTVAILLDGVKEENQLFENLYLLITSNVAIEQDFYDVFDSLIIVLYREEKAEEKIALERLGNVKNRLETERERESVDRLK